MSEHLVAVDLYLTTHSNLNRQKSMSPVGFEPTFSTSKRSQTNALDRAVTGTVYRLRLDVHISIEVKIGKAVPLQAWTGPEGSRKLRLPDFVTTAQDSGRWSALRTGRLYLQEILLVLISVRG